MKIYKKEDKVAEELIDVWVEFLHAELGEFRDTKEEIRLAIMYALKDEKSAGGFVIEYTENESLLACAVLNFTGMKKYIPANILVYLAVSENARGKGIGKRMVEKIISETEGGIALHVEPQNKAKALYEQLGFTNKYLEMRYIHK